MLFQKLKNNSIYIIFIIVSDIYNKLTLDHKRKLFLLMTYTLFTAMLEVFSLGMVIPFLGVLLNNSYVIDLPILGNFFNYLVFSYDINLSVLISLIFVFAAIVVALSRIYLLRFNALFTVTLGSNFSIRVFRNYLSTDYSDHIKKNSSDILAEIKEKVDLTVFAVLLPALNLFSSLLIAISIIIFLFYINFFIAFIVSIIFLPIYLFVVYKSKRSLHNNSLLIQEKQPKTIKIIQESIGSIRDIILNQNNNFYLDKFRNPDYILRLAQAKNVIIASFPRYVLECVGIVLIALFALLALLISKNLIDFIPILGALALGAQRILPLLQTVFANWASIQGYGTSAFDVLKNLHENEDKIHLSKLILKPFPFKKSIEFKNVSFRHNENKNETIKDINFKINKGDKVAIIGKTGSGKSTLIDLISGLLRPSSGQIYIDNKRLTLKNIKKWQQNIALVPQTIFLSDETILENVCIGLELKNIDFDKFKSSINSSHLSTFIDSLPNGHKTLVGERGVKLSGGQRQRIGIARALYKNKKVIIFDEATNALDEKTEQIIMNNLKKLSPDTTLIIISHRPKTVSFCNKVIKV